MAYASSTRSPKELVWNLGKDYDKKDSATARRTALGTAPILDREEGFGVCKALG